MPHTSPSVDQQDSLPITVSGAGYSVRQSEAVAGVPCPCGTSRRVVTCDDQLGVSFHVTDIDNAEMHYHRKTAEIYYILEGTGLIELDGTQVRVGPGSVVTIAPGVRHALTADDRIRTIVVASPAFDPADEFLD